LRDSTSLLASSGWAGSPADSGLLGEPVEHLSAAGVAQCTAVNCQISWFWLKFREAGRVVLVRPSGCVFSARRGRASGVLVPGTVTVYPAYRTNRVSILDAIDQPSVSRNLSQNQL